MLASPNPGYFTYDGDQSLPADVRGQPVVPEGSAGIERTLVAYLKSAGKTAQDTSFDGRSDYDGFTLAGIPAGGLFSGAEDKKSDEQAKLWGGTANEPFDPNYHQKTDTLDHIDRTSLGINGGGVAYAVALYAQDLGGRNGVPIMDDRTRHVLAKHMIRRLGATLLLLTGLLAGCSPHPGPRPGPPAAAPDLGQGLAGKGDRGQDVRAPARAAGYRQRQQGEPGRGHAGLRCQRRVRGKSIARQGFRRVDAAVRPVVRRIAGEADADSRRPQLSRSIRPRCWSGHRPAA